MSTSRRHPRAILFGFLLVTACRDDEESLPDAADVDAASFDSGTDASASDASADGGAEAGAEVDASWGRAFEIAFRGMVGSEAAACGSTYAGFGPSGDQVMTIKDFRFYVHGIEWVRSDGTTEPLVLDDEAPFQRDGVALVDLEDQTGLCVNGTPALRTVVRGRAAPGPYAKLRFVLGVPFALNHLDRSTAAAPLHLSPLFWSWQGGYIFHRLDVFTVPDPDGGVAAGFSVHLGSTGCDGSPVSGGTTSCAAPNRPVIELDGFDPDAHVVLADVARLLVGVDLTVNTPGTAVGCMSSTLDPECAEILPRLGLPFESAPADPSYFSVGTR